MQGSLTSGPLPFDAVADVGPAARVYGWLGTTDADGRFRVAWAAGWSFVPAGPVPDEVVASMWASIGRDEQQRMRQALRQVHRGEIPEHLEHAHTAPDGRRADVWCWFRPTSRPGAFAVVGQVRAVDGDPTPPAALAASTRLFERWQRSEGDADEVTEIALEGYRAAWSMHAAEDDAVRRTTRRELAADLHDGPLQLQHLLIAQLEGALEVVAAGGDPADLVRQMRQTARRAADELRVVVGELDPAGDRSADVGRELMSAVRRWQEDSATIGPVPHCRTVIDPLQTRGATAVALRRVLAEALNNVTKHARAQSVSVTLRVSGGIATLVVDDDGEGFDGPRPHLLGEQRGISGMRNRLAALGGAVDVTSAPGRGSTLRAWVPL